MTTNEAGAAGHDDENDPAESTAGTGHEPAGDGGSDPPSPAGPGQRLPTEPADEAAYDDDEADPDDGWVDV
ncbi:hypothetical protein [Haloactinopolyspora sp.]|uniref:hypothetical protein n=1 Tax=Haloactinopolyspora sp. TaxID=1966353 RepID=UPI00262D162A|nr:hypothetical protein [Haloactinopolyspora sp.]